MFNAAELESLAASIASDGCLARPLVRPMPGGQTWEIVYGERRIRAQRDVLGRELIECEIRELTDEQAARAMLVENINRVDIDPIAEAHAYADRIERFGTEPARIAAECGIPPARVRGRLKLLSLSEHVAHYVATRQLPLGHAQLMTGLDHNRQALALAAYNDGPLGLAVFGRVCARLADDQAAEAATGLFDGADFMQVAEWVADEQAAQAAVAPAQMVRERCYGLTEAAELVGLSIGQLRAMARREAFPPADLTIEGRPAWWAGTLDQWCADEGRAQPVRMVRRIRPHERDRP